MARNIVTGLDIGTSSIRVMVCEFKEHDEAPTVLALVKRSTRGLRRGYIINFDEALESLKEAIGDVERIAKIKVKKVLLGIGGITLESKIAEGSAQVSKADLEITKNDVKRAVEDSENNLTDMANRHILHRLPISFKLDGKKVLGQPAGLKGSKLEVKTNFITYSKLHLKDFVSLVEELGLIIDDIIASPLASSITILTKLQKASGCVLANIGSQTATIAVFEEGLPISVHTFPLGSTDITNDIALGFKIPLEEAERVKRRETDPAGAKKKLDEIIEARLSDIFEYIEVHLKKIGRSGLLPAGIVITGGGSNIQNVEEMAKDYFKLPARVASPAKIQGQNNQTIDPSWSVVYGLCLYDYEYEDGEKSGSHNRGELWSRIVRWVKEIMP